MIIATVISSMSSIAIRPAQCFCDFLMIFIFLAKVQRKVMRVVQSYQFGQRTGSIV